MTQWSHHIETTYMSVVKAMKKLLVDSQWKYLQENNLVANPPNHSDLHGMLNIASQQL